jgi:hypothetical protein
MAMKSRPTMMKRARERARAEKQKEKAARRLERAQQAADRPRVPEGVDPDIAHIQAGPQPPAEWQLAEADEDEPSGDRD